MGFVEQYNSWKTENPEQKSYFENHIHHKALLNLKLSFLLPGAGLEIGLHEKLSVNTMIKSVFGYFSPYGWNLDPFMDNQLRYYTDVHKRKSKNLRTYKYTGNYICLTQILILETNENLIGLAYGWQRTYNKHWYSNLGIGVAKSTNSGQKPVILYDFDFGYTF